MLDRLPFDVLFNIVNSNDLSIHDVLNVRLVCRACLESTETRPIWYSLMQSLLELIPSPYISSKLPDMSTSELRRQATNAWHIDKRWQQGTFRRVPSPLLVHFSGNICLLPGGEWLLEEELLKFTAYMVPDSESASFEFRLRRVHDMVVATSICIDIPNRTGPASWFHLKVSPSGRLAIYICPDTLLLFAVKTNESPSLHLIKHFSPDDGQEFGAAFIDDDTLLYGSSLMALESLPIWHFLPISWLSASISPIVLNLRGTKTFPMSQLALLPDRLIFCGQESGYSLYQLPPGHRTGMFDMDPIWTFKPERFWGSSCFGLGPVVPLPDGGWRLFSYTNDNIYVFTSQKQKGTWLRIIPTGELIPPVMVGWRYAFRGTHFPLGLDFITIPGPGDGILGTDGAVVVSNARMLLELPDMPGVPMVIKNVSFDEWSGRICVHLQVTRKSAVFVIESLPGFLFDPLSHIFAV